MHEAALFPHCHGSKHTQECVVLLSSLRVVFLLAAGSILLAYFLWERGPCHQSQTSEHISLSMALLLFSAAYFLAETPAESHHPHTLLRCAQIMLVLLASRAYGASVKLTALPRMFEEADTRSFTACFRSSAEVSCLARRVLIKLRGIENKLLKKGMFYSFLDRTAALQPVMFIMIAIQIHILSRAKDTPLSAFPATVALWIVLFIPLLTAVARIWSSRLALQHLHRVLTCLVETGNSVLISEVLRTTSLPTLLQFADASCVRYLADTCIEMNLLTTEAKAVFLNAFQKIGLYKYAQAVRKLLLSCDGDELMVLKALLDSSADYHDLYQLVYAGMLDSSLQLEIVTHLQEQALQLRHQKGGRLGLKIVSDIDDTVICSGGMFPAGCDTRLPRHMVYPGCMALFRELDETWEVGKPSSNLVFLSARPRVYKDLTARRTFSVFKELFHRGKLHSLPSLITGSMRRGVLATLRALCSVRTAWQQVGEKKVECFQRYRALYAEYDFVFFGDNGQGDLLAAQRMQESLLHPRFRTEISSDTSDCSSDESGTMDEESRATWESPADLLGLIQEVVPLESSLMHHQATAEALRDEDIVMYRSYVGAALEICRIAPKLITPLKLQCIAKAACQDLEDAKRTWAEWKPGQWREMEVTLRNDLQAASEVLINAGLEAIEREFTADCLAQAATYRTIRLQSALMIDESEY